VNERISLREVPVRKRRKKEKKERKERKERKKKESLTE